MGRRWLLGAGWVVVVAVGGAILSAGGHDSPVPASVSRAPAPSGGSPAPTPPAAAPRTVVAPGASSSVPATLASGPSTDRAQPQTVLGPDGRSGDGRGAATQTAVPRVAGVSYVLDILQKVSTVGPGVANGVAATVLSAAFQGLPEGAGATLVAGTGKLAEQLSTQAPLTIEQARGMIAQLSVVNPEVAQALALAAQALAGASSPAISPFDLTAVQLAGVLSSLAEPGGSSTP